MTYKIKTGKHRAWPLTFGLRHGRTVVKRRVCFSFNCKYDHDTKDQFDTNKLFGIAFSNFWRLMWICISWPVFAVLNRNRHHDDSARFGWRYDINKQKFILSAYCYVNGKRIIKDLCEALATWNYTCTLMVLSDCYSFYVQKENGESLASYTIERTHKKRWSFPLGIYFGGNRKAPHDMTIQMKKL